MIKLTEVTRCYGQAQALKNVSFEVHRGEIVGFLGPNGAGKTTTMKIITGFLAPTRGSVDVDGFDVVEDSLEVRRRIGYLPENSPVYPDMRVDDYLSFVGRIRGLSGTALASRLKESIQLTGLDRVVTQDISTLSKGYRQRVGLAQALIHDPPILILDEPTTGLDPNQIVDIRSMIKEIGREKTVILSSHILSEVEATADRVIIISKGELVADGAPDELEKRFRQARVLLTVELPRASNGQDKRIEEAKAKLSTISGADLVAFREIDPLHFQASLSSPDDDEGLRRMLFSLAVEAGWILLEMKRESHGLEALFQNLTREA